MGLLLRWVVVSLLAGAVKILVKLVAGKIFPAAISGVIIYATLFNVDAANAFLLWVRDNMPELASDVNFSGVGTLIQAIRLDDCLLVTTGAYVTGWMHRLIFKSSAGTSKIYD